jgi:hypothetical protein
VVATEPRLRARLSVTRFDQAVTVASSVTEA